MEKYYINVNHNVESVCETLAYAAKFFNEIDPTTFIPTKFYDTIEEARCSLEYRPKPGDVFWDIHNNRIYKQTIVDVVNTAKGYRVLYYINDDKHWRNDLFMSEDNQIPFYDNKNRFYNKKYAKEALDKMKREASYNSLVKRFGQEDAKKIMEYIDTDIVMMYPQIKSMSRQDLKAIMNSAYGMVAGTTENFILKCSNEYAILLGTDSTNPDEIIVTIIFGIYNGWVVVTKDGSEHHFDCGYYELPIEFGPECIIDEEIKRNELHNMIGPYVDEFQEEIKRNTIHNEIEKIIGSYRIHNGFCCCNNDNDRKHFWYYNEELDAYIHCYIKCDKDGALCYYKTNIDDSQQLSGADFDGDTAYICHKADSKYPGPWTWSIPRNDTHLNTSYTKLLQQVEAEKERKRKEAIEELDGGILCYIVTKRCNVRNTFNEDESLVCDHVIATYNRKNASVIIRSDMYNHTAPRVMMLNQWIKTKHFYDYKEMQKYCKKHNIRVMTQGFTIVDEYVNWKE